MPTVLMSELCLSVCSVSSLRRTWVLNFISTGYFYPSILYFCLENVKCEKFDKIWTGEEARLGRVGQAQPSLYPPLPNQTHALYTTGFTIQYQLFLPLQRGLKFASERVTFNIWSSKTGNSAKSKKIFIFYQKIIWN